VEPIGVEPLFEAIKWAGIAYLAFLAIQSLRLAAAGRYLPFDEERTRLGSRLAVLELKWSLARAFGRRVVH
jgi:threonine/homoserine/homoserine lactone efflux protein